MRKKITYSKDNILEAAACHIEKRIEDVKRWRAQAKKRADARDGFDDAPYKARIDELSKTATMLRGFKTPPPEPQPASILDILKEQDRYD